MCYLLVTMIMELPCHQPPLFSMVILLLVLLLSVTITDHAESCIVGFYKNSCPKAELIVHTIVGQALSHNWSLGAGLLRLHFHDCFVQGCDGSVLLDSTPGNTAEKEAIPNLSLRGFEVIDAVKAQLEAHCPNVVSCADILAFAARDSVHMLGGPFWQVPAGRRDGLVSKASLALANLPAPTFNVKQLTHSFGCKGLTQDDMVTLSGAHTIGIAHCTSFQYRLYNFSNTLMIDPTLNEQLAEAIKSSCPWMPSSNRFPDQRSTNVPNPTVALDMITPHKFDNAYYANLQLGQGLLQSDEALFSDPITSEAVRSNADSELTWTSKFKKAMIKMSLIEVKTEEAGEIRQNCRLINSVY